MSRHKNFTVIIAFSVLIVKNHIYRQRGSHVTVLGFLKKIAQILWCFKD